MWVRFLLRIARMWLMLFNSSSEAWTEKKENLALFDFIGSSFYVEDDERKCTVPMNENEQDMWRCDRVIWRLLESKEIWFNACVFIF